MKFRSKSITSAKDCDQNQKARGAQMPSCRQNSCSCIIQGIQSCLEVAVVLLPSSRSCRVASRTTLGEPYVSIPIHPIGAVNLGHASPFALGMLVVKLDFERDDAVFVNNQCIHFDFLDTYHVHGRKRLLVSYHVGTSPSSILIIWYGQVCKLDHRARRM